MLNTLKWIYNLGKVHERRRIEAILRNETNRPLLVPEPENGGDMFEYELQARLNARIYALLDYTVIKETEYTRPIDE